MRTIRTIALAILALSVIPCAARAADLSSTVFQPGEELVYKVKYGFVRLGTVTISTVRDNNAKNGEYHIVWKMESNPSVPFFSLNEYDESVVDVADLMSQRFYGRSQRSGKNVETQFHYEAGDRKAYFSRKDLINNVFLDNYTIDNVPAYLEGPSMLFYGRANSKSREVRKVPTMIDGKIGVTTLDFTKGRAYIDIDAVDHVRTRKYEGDMSEAAGSVAVSGGFSVWVSDDDAAVPMRVQMQITVGSITLELEKWTRANWQPPT